MNYLRACSFALLRQFALLAGLPKAVVETCFLIEGIAGLCLVALVARFHVVFPTG